MSKAFDSIHHNILSINYAMLVFQLLLFDGFIVTSVSNRNQRVRINSTLSEALPLVSGIPQGSIMGPLLFTFIIWPCLTRSGNYQIHEFDWLKQIY